MQVVITGATSFIGVHLIERWMKEDCCIYAVVRKNSNNIDRIPISNRVRVVELNMQEYAELPLIIKHADVFYHLAWDGVRAPWRDDQQVQKENYICTINAMEAASKMGCTLFVGSGSQAEYGIVNGPVDESHPCNPSTEYGKYKLRAYETLSHMAKRFNVRLIWLRIFSLYGEFDYSGSLIMSCINSFSRNEPLKMTACTQKWDYLYIKDAVEAMFRFAVINCEDGVYHIANGNSRPLKDYVEEIKSIMHSESTIEYGAIPYGPNGPVNLEPIAKRVQRTLNWKANTLFTSGILSILHRESDNE